MTLSVTAPPEWTVAANGQVADRPAPGRWEFAPTAPLATYFFSLIAGPWHVRRAEHDGIPLGVYCRRSLAEHLDADAEEIFTVTRQCLDRFHQLFAERYPFGKYDQAFVPEFNAGAMENPGLVTLRDDYVFRSAGHRHPARAAGHHHRPRDGAHVVRRPGDHALVGRPVAERVLRGVPGHPGHRRGHPRSTRRGPPSRCAARPGATRPTSAPPPTRWPRRRWPTPPQALLNFDGISYAKGASVLRQLVAWLGDDAFLAGLNAHFAKHRFGNATLADLLDSLAAASGRDLAGWAERWLRRSQVNTLRMVAAVDADGRWPEVAVVQTAPAAYPVLRPHRIGVARYAADGPGAPPRGRPGPGRRAGPHRVDRADRAAGATGLLLPNAGDLTFAKIRLDPASADAVPMLLPGLDDPLARALLWGEALDAATDGERPVAALVALIAAALPAETEVIIAEDVLALARDLVDRYLEPLARDAALLRLAGACATLLAGAPAGGSLQLAAARGLIGATVDTGLLAGWLAGRDVPAGLAVDAELRWALLHRLVVLGAPASRRSPPRRPPTAAPPAPSGPPAAGPRCPTPTPSGPPGRSSSTTPSCPTGWWRRPPRGSGSRSRPS